MKLKVQFEMPLPEGFEPFLKVIAEIHGYSEAAYPDKSVEQFICEGVCAPQVSNLFRIIVTNALTPYFGIAGKEQVDTVLTVYQQSHAVTAEIVVED
ncbi:hypothetical protein EBT16_01675 [bacterium]|nr:hypothetical protein [bacterium]